MIEKSKRLLWLDVIKVIAAFFVCFYHLTAHNRYVDYGSFSDGIYVPTIEKFLYGILASSVPLFFVASGVTLLLKHRTTKKNIYSAFRLMLICIVCGFFCNIVLKSIVQKTIVFSWSFIFYQPHYFWYFKTLAGIYIFDIVWKKIKNKIIKNSIFCGLLVFPFLSNFAWDIVIAYNPSYNLPQWGHTGFFCLYSLVYILIPQISYKTISVWKCISLICIGLMLVLFEVYAFSTHEGTIFDGVNSSFPTLGALCITWTIYAYIRQLRICENRLTLFISWISKNCLGIYILHYIFVELLRIYTPILEHGWPVQFFMTCLIIVLSASISECVRYILKKLFQLVIFLYLRNNKKQEVVRLTFRMISIVIPVYHLSELIIQ